MKAASTVIISLLLLIPYVSAHGVVSKLTIDGKSYKGNAPSQDGKRTTASVIRRISKTDPVKGANNPSVNCGNDAKAASLSATAKPGSKLLFEWSGGDNEKWPHNTGPMLTYMASCGNTTCDKFDSKTAKWFKIDEVGRKKSGKWVQEDLMNGKPANVTLPKNIAAGNYLIRHEIIALHLANKKFSGGKDTNGAEFYPSCSQLKITGNGTGVPKADELVALPGAYKDTDPGIFDKNIFDTKAKYTFPGPPIASFVSSGSSGSGLIILNPSGSNSTASSNAASSKTTSNCSKTKAKRDTVRPRHISRVMRNINPASF